MGTTWQYMFSHSLAAALLTSVVACGAGCSSSGVTDPNNPNNPNNPGSGNPGFFHTQGSQIVDSSGNPVRLTGVSWFGMETSTFAPHGLDKRTLGSMLDQIKSVGFNSIRIPFCTQMFDAGSTPNGIDFGKNPDLQGKKPLELLDIIVAQAGQRGLRIILDRHRPDSGGQSEVWFTGQYSEQRWIDDWKMLATRYKGNPTVVGFDLHNEPHGQATWGSGSQTTDWRAAAGRVGNEILAIHPDILLIVEGIEQYSGKYYWWGGNLTPAGANPVQVQSAGHIVYSPHDYPASVYGQSWFSDPGYPSNLPGVWDTNWGYLAKQNLAPVWLGEFGTKLQTDSDTKWLTSLVSYLQQNKLSFAYWCWNPNSGDTGGILQDDWTNLNQNKIDVIKPALAPGL